MRGRNASNPSIVSPRGRNLKTCEKLKLFPASARSTNLDCRDKKAGTNEPRCKRSWTANYNQIKIAKKTEVKSKNESKRNLGAKIAHTIKWRRAIAQKIEVQKQIAEGRAKSIIRR